MSKEMDKIDSLIKEALSKEEAAFYDELEEQGLLAKLGAVHKGKMGWLVIMMNLVTLAAFVFLIYCGIRFFNSDQTNEIIRWGSGAFLCMMLMSMMKLYIWLQMDKNDIIRELKRLELQLAAMAHKK